MNAWPLLGLFLGALLGYHLQRWVRPIPVRPNDTTARWLPDDDAPLVSFLVPAWNAAEDIAGFVATFHALEYPHKELVLCAGGNDLSFALAQRWADPRVTVLEQKAGEGKQRALAKSLAASCGNIIYLTDIDCRLDTTSVLEVLAPLVCGDEQVVTGSSAPLETQRTLAAVVVHWATERQVGGTYARAVDGVLGRNCALTRAAAEHCGGFRYEAPTGTDYHLAQRLTACGYRLWLEPGSEIRTSYAWPLPCYARKQARWLRNVILYAERPRQAVEFRAALVTLALPYGLLLLLLLAFVLHMPLPAFGVVLLLLHGVFNRLHYVRETLAEDYLTFNTVRGSVLNLLATFAASFYTSVTLLTPALRRQW